MIPPTKAPLPTVAAVVLATFFWGSNFPLVHFVVADLDPLAAVFGRFSLAALAATAFAFYRGQPIRLFRQARTLGVIGVFGVGGFNVLFFLAMQRTSSVNGALIMATNPLVTTLLAALVLGDRPSRRQIAALPVAMAGVAGVILGGGAKMTIASGDLLMLAADVVWASYNVAVQRLVPPGNGFGDTAAIMIWSAVAVGATAAVAGVVWAMPGPLAGACLVEVALGGTVLGYLLYNHGLTKLGAGKTVLFMNMVPVWAMLVSIGFGQFPSWTQVLGGVAVIGAVSIALLPARRPNEAPSFPSATRSSRSIRDR